MFLPIAFNLALIYHLRIERIDDVFLEFIVEFLRNFLRSTCGNSRVHVQGRYTYHAIAFDKSKQTRSSVSPNGT